MSAPVRNLMRLDCQAKRILFGHSYLFRNYRRPAGRSGRINVISQEEEHGKLTSRNIEIRNPKQSTYTDFNLDDPVMGDLVKSWETLGKSKKVIKPNKHRDKPLDSTSHKKKVKSALPPGVVQVVSKYGLKYSDVNDKSSTFKDDMIKLKSKKEREALGEIVLDSTVVIKKSLQSEGTMKRLYFTDEEQLRALPLNDSTKEHCDFYKVPSKQMKFWIGSRNPAGLIGVFDKPDNEIVKKLHTNLVPMTVILDQVYNSDIMATILRTAVAFGCTNILVMPDCADIWETKVLKAGMGCHFNISIYDNLEWKFIDDFVPKPSQLILLDTYGLTKEPKQHVIDPETLHELVSQIESDIEHYSNLGNGNGGYASVDHLGNYEHVPLPLTELSKLNINSDSHVVFVINGIKRFTSLQAKKLVYDNLGTRVTIPMHSATIGFDAGVGSSIVMSHIFQQCHKQTKIQLPKEKEEEEEI